MLHTKQTHSMKMNSEAKVECGLTAFSDRVQQGDNSLPEVACNETGESLIPLSCLLAQPDGHACSATLRHSLKRTSIGPEALPCFCSIAMAVSAYS